MNNQIKSWDDITVRQFIELLELEKEEFESYYQYQIEKLAIVLDLDIDDDDFLDMDSDELIKLLNEYSWLNREPNIKTTTEFNDYQLIDSKDLIVGAYIDLDYFIKDITNLPLLAAIYYRQIKTNEWGHKVIEPYKYDINERANEFMDAPITTIYNVYKTFGEFKQWLYESYKHTYIDPEDLEDEFETENLDNAEIEEIKRSIEEDKALAEIAWPLSLLNHSNDEFYKVEKYLEMNIIFYMNMVSVKTIRDSKQK